MNEPKKNQDGSLDNVWCVQCQRHQHWDARTATRTTIDGKPQSIPVYLCHGCRAVEDARLLDIALGFNQCPGSTPSALPGASDKAGGVNGA